MAQPHAPTSLFTDIEGSAELLRRLGRDGYESVLTEHARLLAAAAEAYGGRVVGTQGDSVVCEFRSVRDAVSAAVDGQHALAAHEWPDEVRVRVRMGVHSGDRRSVTRIGTAAHGGQVVLSEAARGLVADDLPAGASLLALGAHRVDGIDEPVRLYQLLAPGLEERFPALRTLRRRRRRFRDLVVAAFSRVGPAASASRRSGNRSGP